MPLNVSQNTAERILGAIEKNKDVAKAAIDYWSHFLNPILTKIFGTDYSKIDSQKKTFATDLKRSIVSSFSDKTGERKVLEGSFMFEGEKVTWFSDTENNRCYLTIGKEVWHFNNIPLSDLFHNKHDKLN